MWEYFKEQPPTVSTNCVSVIRQWLWFIWLAYTAYTISFIKKKLNWPQNCQEIPLTTGLDKRKTKEITFFIIAVWYACLYEAILWK